MCVCVCLMPLLEDVSLLWQGYRHVTASTAERKETWFPCQRPPPKWPLLHGTKSFFKFRYSISGMDSDTKKRERILVGKEETRGRQTFCFLSTGGRMKNKTPGKFLWGKKQTEGADLHSTSQLQASNTERADLQNLPQNLFL